MGQPKLLLPWNGGTVIEKVLQSWRASHIDQVVVVVHPADTQLAAICRDAGCSVIVPPVAPPDMKTSVLHGLDAAARQWQPAATDPWLLAPADMPRLTTSAINAVLESYCGGPPRIVAASFQGRRGHPVALPWSLADGVRKLGPDEGINRLLAQHPVVDIDVADPSVLEDLDTPQDYRRP